MNTLEKERDYYKGECESLQDMMRKRLTSSDSPTTKRKGKSKGKVETTQSHLNTPENEKTSQPVDLPQVDLMSFFGFEAAERATKSRKVEKTRGCLLPAPDSDKGRFESLPSVLEISITHQPLFPGQ